MQILFLGLTLILLFRIIQDLRFDVPDAETQELFYDIWEQLMDAELDAETAFLQHGTRFVF